LEGRKRPFNRDYLALMRHYGMTPRTTAVGAKQQNGDVEASNGAVKSRLKQHLLLRGSRDFESVDAWQAYIDSVLFRSNQTKRARVDQELLVMSEIDVSKLAEYVEEKQFVSRQSTIRVKGGCYSVPSRLMREEVKIRVYHDKIEVYYAGDLQLACERVRSGNKRINYRHVIWSLVRKPGAFARYVYRDEMFPSLVFRRAYDAIQGHQQGIKGDVEYLRILHQAASTVEADVETALTLLLDEESVIDADAVKALVTSKPAIDVPQLSEPKVELAVYDGLLSEVGS